VPGPKPLAIAAVLGIGVAGYFALWLHWPTFLAVAIGATMAIVLLLFASSLSDDGVEADAAWRAAAPDLIARERDVEDGSGSAPPARREGSR
jgi:hypothetical protein